MTTAKQQRRAAKKQRTAGTRQRRTANLDQQRRESGLLSSRYVCDKCGLEQPVRHTKHVEGTEVTVAPCEGPLGIPCDSETAHMLDTFQGAA